MQQSDFLKKIQSDLSLALNEFFPIAKLSPRSLLVVGCSTSEVLGEKIGTHGSAETADVIFHTLFDFCREHSLFLAAQCCEHLNRALILDKSSCDAQLSANRVNVVPMPHAGGSLPLPLTVLSPNRARSNTSVPTQALISATPLSACI